MSAMRRCGGCGYIPRGNGESVLECVPCARPAGKLRMLPEAAKAKEEQVSYGCAQRWPRIKVRK